tara:strand:+ start:220 stop:468 length:249 start_codon:yes stop_codon:yes gene_type:complete
MLFLNKIIPLYFLLALFIGLFFTYTLTPAPDVIIKYPTPEDKNTIYQDDVENCFKFISEEITCPLNKSEIKEIPIQSKKMDQ